MKLVIEIDEDIRIAISRMGLLRIPDEMQKKVDKAIQHGTPIDQEPKTDYKAFAEWVAREVIDEENWEWNSPAFPEVACRKLNKIGIVDTDGNKWIYEGEGLEQEPKIDILKQIRAEINHTYEQEKEIDTKWAAGLKYSLKIIDKAMSEVSE